uniref:DDE-1 domain-containing protein n=1 Tax=Peronospora matthiolae TaxID=2874970 RepID=A0AAV1TRK6_9STRA
MDAGIIRNFKLKYKAQFVQWLLDMVTTGTEDKKLDVISAIRMVVKSWMRCALKRFDTVGSTQESCRKLWRQCSVGK